MIRACLCLLAGVYALQLSSFAYGSDLPAIALVAFFVALFLRAWRDLSWLFAGIALFALAAHMHLSERLAPAYAGDSMVARVQVADFPERRGASVSFVARTLGDARLPPLIRLSWFEPAESIRLGDTWQVEMRLRRPRGNRNPGGFDYEAWLFRTGIGATGYVVPGHRNERLRSGAAGMIQRYRQRVVDRLERVAQTPGNAAVLAAVTVGARHLVSRDQWERYARTGTSHLMAISGLHIGLAGGGAYVIVSIALGLLRVASGHVAATAAAAAVAAGYGLVSGLALPSQRAACMIALLAAAVVRRRRPRPAVILAAACLLLSLLSPLGTMAPGFKLSFGAVLILIWLARRRSRLRNGSPRIPGFGAIRELGVVQVMLLAGLLPLTAGIFGRVSLVAPAVNLVAVPVFSFVSVPLALGGMLLDGPLAFAGDRLLWAASWSVGVIEAVIAHAADVPGGAGIVPELHGGARALLLLPLAWAALPPGWPGRGVAWLGLAALLLYEPRRPGPGCFEADVLDVGQGLAIAVRAADHVLLYDTGPAFRSGRSMADAVVLPFLASRQIRRVDTLVVSHADLDHAGGVRQLLHGIETGTVLAGESLQGVSRAYRPCRAGSEWLAGGIGFRILHPEKGTGVTGNDASCVLLVEAGQHRLIAGGDIERAAETALLRRGRLPPVDVAIVPHHGSRTSSSQAFVDALRPELAIVSASYRNRWGLPKDDVVRRWQAAGARVLDTAASGAITVRICAATGLESVSRYRPDHRRIWHE